MLTFIIFLLQEEIILKVLFKRGFTLFELLAVLAIISIVAGITIPRVMQTIKNAKIEKIMNEMSLVHDALLRMITEYELKDAETCPGLTLSDTNNAPLNSDNYNFITWQHAIYNDTPGFGSLIAKYIDLPAYIGVEITYRSNGIIRIRTTYPGVSENSTPTQVPLPDVLDPNAQDDDTIMYYGGISCADFAGENWPVADDGDDANDQIDHDLDDQIGVYELDDTDGVYIFFTDPNNTKGGKWFMYNQAQDTFVAGDNVTCIIYRGPMREIQNPDHSHIDSGPFNIELLARDYITP